MRKEIFDMPNRYRTCEQAETALLQFAANLGSAFGVFKVTKQEEGGFAFRSDFGDACVYLDASIVEDLAEDVGEIYHIRCDVYVDLDDGIHEPSRMYVGKCKFEDDSFEYTEDPWTEDFDVIESAFDNAKDMG